MYVCMYLTIYPSICECMYVYMHVSIYLSMYVCMLICINLSICLCIYPSVSSVAQLCPTLQPHGLQHTRLPCPSPILGACSNSYPSSWWCHATIYVLGWPKSHSGFPVTSYGKTEWTPWPTQYIRMHVCMCNYLCIYLSVNVCVCIRRIAHDWAHMHLPIYWQISLSISHFSFDLHPLILLLTCLPDSLVAKPDGWILTSSIWLYLFLQCIEVHNLAEDSLPKSHGGYLSPFTSSATRAGSS